MSANEIEVGVGTGKMFDIGLPMNEMSQRMISRDENGANSTNDSKTNQGFGTEKSVGSGLATKPQTDWPSLKNGHIATRKPKQQ